MLLCLDPTLGKNLAYLIAIINCLQSGPCDSYSEGIHPKHVVLHLSFLFCGTAPLDILLQPCGMQIPIPLKSEYNSTI